MAQKRLNLNLASSPLWNRRFFYFLLAVLSLLAFFILINGTVVYVKYKTKSKQVSLLLLEQKQLDSQITKESKKLNSAINYLEETGRDKVDFINSLIMSKSFLWMEFLTELEEILPPSSYIESLVPAIKKNNKMEVVLVLATPFLTELLNFLAELNKRNYLPREIEERQKDNGYLLATVSYVYERTH